MANVQPYYLLIKRPIVTEKTTTLQSIRNQYTFRVDPAANKRQIKKAIEALFSVHVEKVAVLNVPGKMRRIMGRPAHTRDWKKAIVSLRKGETIDMT